MPETDWKPVAKRLAQLLQGPDEEQVQVAAQLGLLLDATVPEPVAAALLRSRLRTPLGLRAAKPFGDSEWDYLEDLARSVGIAVPDRSEIANRDELDGWLTAARARRASDGLTRLRPVAGDVVVQGEPPSEEYGVVSSIGPKGRLYFRGGQGRGAWPHQVARIVHVGESGHSTARYQAEQEAAAWNKSPQRVGPGVLAQLDRWKVSEKPSPAAASALEDTLEIATDERPFQTVLAAHPALLAHLKAGNHGTWVRPWPKLGSEYVPDFVIASQTSRGLEWTLVELESPSAPLTLKDGQPGQILRKAIKQVDDWREWLRVVP